MNTSSYKIVLLIISTFIFLFSCSRKESKNGNIVAFNVGFENFKTNQRIYTNNDGKEEIYFLGTKYNCCIKFYDLQGNPTDSISLKQASDSIGEISRINVITKDSIIIISHHTGIMAGIKRNNLFIFKINIPSLADQKDESYYQYSASFFPSPFIEKDNAILFLTWNGDKREKEFSSQLDYYKHIFESRMHTPILCKIESIYSERPKMKCTPRDYYYKLSSTIKSYDVVGKQYVILNGHLFFINAHERNIYRIDWNTMEIVDTIPVIPDIYEIPKGIPYANDDRVNEDMLAEKEIQEKCRITNMLYNEKKHQYYVFLRTAKDISTVDELGYSFRIYIYDEKFKKLKDIPFETDLYNPKAAVMTSKGIMIERTPKDKEYGKRTFEFMDL